MTSPATVLFIHSGQDWIRGSERVVLDLAGGLPADRFRPLLWCNAAPLRSAWRHQGLVVVDEPFPPDSDAPFWRFPAATVTRAASLMAERGAGLVHVNALECLPWAIRAARRARIPIAVHLHSPTTLQERIWSGVHQVNAAVGVSRSVLSWSAAEGFPASAARLIYNAVVPERLEQGVASNLRAGLGISSAACVVTVVASLIDRKDVGCVLDAFRRLKDSGSEVHLLVVGEGPERERLESQASAGGLSAIVHFLGERDDAGAIFRDATDVLVSAALTESFGLTLAEAGYFGIPSVASDIAPHREIVVEGESGLLVPAGNSEELARQILKLCGDSTLRRVLGAGARQRVRELFLGERFFAEFVQLYQELLDLPRWRQGWFGSLRVPRVYFRFGLSRALGLTPSS